MSPKQPTRERVLTVSEIAAETKMCTKTVRRWIDDGKLKSIRFGTAIRVERVELEVFLARLRAS